MTALVALLAALLPFERIGAFDVAGVNVRPSQLALLLVLAATALMALRGSEVRHRLSAIFARREMLALAVFLGVATLSLVRAENFGRSLVVLAFIAFTATQTLVLPLWLHDAADFLKVRALILWSAAAVALFGLWQFVGDMAGAPTWLTGLRPQYTKIILGFTRVQGPTAEPLYFADYLLLPLGLALAWLLAKGDKPASRKLWILLILLCLDLALTSSRGGWAGALATVLTLAWCYRRHWTSIKRLAAAGVIALGGITLALGLVGSFATTRPGSVLGDFTTHVTNLTSGAGIVERLDTYALGLAAFRTSPWLGVGIGGYGPFAATYAWREPDVGWAIVNNEPIELLAEVGIVGLAAFLIFLATIFAAARRTEKETAPDLEALKIGTLAALVGMLVQYQTFSTLYVMHFWFTIGLLMAASRRDLPESR